MLLACVALVAVATAREDHGHLARPTLHDAMRSMLHVVRPDVPAVPDKLFEVSRDQAQVDAPYCGNTIIPLQLTEDAPCNVSVGVCTEDGGKTWACNATALLNGTADKSVGFGQTFTNQTVAFYDVLYRLLNVMDATINHTDCSCTAIDIPEGTGCSLRVAYCVYMLPEDNSKPFPKNPTLMYRARVWDLEHPEYTGSSEGYKNISAGATNPEDAQLDAANDLRKNFPARSCGELEPLVMVPGFSSSEIQYRMKNSPPPKGHPLCPRDSPNGGNWTDLYPFPNDVNSLLQLPCLMSTIQSVFDPATSTFGPARQGLETRLLDFGGFTGIPGFAPIAAVFQIAGWEIGKNFFGIPFDWRLPSPALEDTFTQMRELIENVTATTGKKVSIWAFSGGPQPALAFLHRQTQAWKDAHVSWFVATSPVWGGVTLATSVVVSGATSPIPGNVNASTKFGLDEIRDLGRALPSALWYFPRGGVNASTGWTKDEPIVTTPSKNYTAFDGEELLQDIGLDSNSVAAYKFLMDDADLGAFAPPLVNTFVTYGLGFPVPISFSYAKDFDAKNADQPYPSSMQLQTGDGLVALRSSIRSTEWAEAQSAAGKQLIHTGYQGQPHAMCFPSGLFGPQAEDHGIGTKCFMDVLDKIRGN